MSWPPIEERLWGRVVRADSGCWEYSGHKNWKGYGSVFYEGKTWAAHRLAYTLTNGPIPDGLMVMHVCDNRPCINPDHLRVGTHADNMADMHAKGRAVSPPEVAWGWQRQKTHCNRGHEFTPENTYFKKKPGNGVRSCRTCERLRNAERRRFRALLAESAPPEAPKDARVELHGDGWATVTMESGQRWKVRVECAPPTEPEVTDQIPPLQCGLCGLRRWNDETVVWLPPSGDDRIPYCADSCARSVMTCEGGR